MNLLRLVKYGVQHCCLMGPVSELIGTVLEMLATVDWEGLPDQDRMNRAYVNRMIKSCHRSCGDMDSSIGAIKRKMFEKKGDRFKFKTRSSHEQLLYLTLLTHIAVYYTTVHLPTTDLGRAVADHLLARLKGQEPPARMELPIDLVVRRSTGPAGP